jgi:hypothetical protein
MCYFLMKKKPELERKPDGKWKWNPIYGKEYPLGYHHGSVCRTGMADQREIKAYFLGSIDCEYRFFEKKDDEILFYSSFCDHNVMFMSEGYDDPSFPFIVSEFEGKLDNPEKKIIIRIIERLEQKLENDKA